MALSAREERLAAEIEAELRDRDESWSRGVDVLVKRLDRQPRVRRALPVVCLLAGIVFVLAGTQAWLSVQVAIISGLPASLVRRTFAIGAYTMALTGALLLARAACERRRRSEPRD